MLYCTELNRIRPRTVDEAAKRGSALVPKANQGFIIRAGVAEGNKIG